MRRFKLRLKETADDSNNASSVILGATVCTMANPLVAKDAVSTFTAPESCGTLSPWTTCFILLALNDQYANDYTGLQCTTSDMERKAARFGKSIHTLRREPVAMPPGVVHNLLTPIAKKALLTWERLESGISFDLTSSEIRANPYDFYERLRRKDPVHRMRLVNAWALTGYEDAQTVLQDHRRFSSGDNKLEYAPYRTILDLDPPDHTRLRSLVSKAFTPRAISALGPRIQQTVEELLNGLADKKRFDLIREFAFPLPVIVIAEMLGIPAQDRDRFNVWSNDIALAVEPILSEEEIGRVTQSSDELVKYFEDIMAERRRRPEDDLLSALLAAEDEGDRLSHDELLGTLMLLLVAGNETTRSLIGNGMLALLKNPAQLQRLWDNPELLDTAIDELLRYDSPVQFIIRVVLEDMEFKGKRLRAGQKVMVLVGAANRDPEVFTVPGILDIGRTEKSHLSFGRGIHYCLGSPLALLEARFAFAGLLARFPSIHLISEPEYRNQIVLRGVEDLWIEVDRESH